MKIKHFLPVLIILIAVIGCQNQETKTKDETSETATTANPLPSWKDGIIKTAIIEFVDKVTLTGGAYYVPPEQRIATFDQDGTLWCEQPVVQLEFVSYQIKLMAAEHPEWKTQLPYKALLEGDKDYLVNDLQNNHGKELMKLISTTHSGMPIETFNGHVETFFNEVKHPKFNKPFSETIYQPMLELLEYLHENDFKTYICSGGGIDFMRVKTEEMYGIVPENIIGSFAINSFEQVDGKWTIVKGDKNLFVNDGLTKPIGIERHIGRIPIFVAGNVRSGGDIGQLNYSKTNSLPNFQLLINHDDEAREYAYAEKNGASLKAAKEGNWQVVSMKNDWLKIFPFEK